MTINDLEAAYNSLGASHACIFSNFQECSKFNIEQSDYYLVNNTTACINLDKAKGCTNMSHAFSVDSLYISKTNNAVYFIEFKNSSYFQSEAKITRKAFETIHIHNEICGFDDYSFCSNVLCCVLSINKEKEKLVRSPLLTSAMMRASHYSINSSYKENLEKRFANHIASKSNAATLPFLYSDCKIVFDDEFDLFVASII